MTTDNPWGLSAETLQSQQMASTISISQAKTDVPIPRHSALPPEFFQTTEEEKIKPDTSGIQYITATFQGMYFKGVGQNKEAISFTRTIKVPYSCLRSIAMHPAWVFLQVAPDVLGREQGYGGVRSNELVATSPLPRDLPRDEMLNWTASYDDLTYFIKRHATNVRYTPTNFNDDGKVLPAKTVTVIPEIYTTSNALRGAIKRCLSDPEAFAKEQAKAEKLWSDPDKTDIRNLNRELKRLNQSFVMATV